MRRLLSFTIPFTLLLLAVCQGTFDQAPQPEPQPEPQAPVPENKVEIVRNLLEAPLMDIIWCGDQKNVVFLLSETNTLYRSADDGATQELMTSHLQALGGFELGADLEKVGRPMSILQSPVNKNVIFILGTRGVNWVTENCGTTFTVMNKDKHFEELKLHPTQKNWALASANAECSENEDEPCENFKQLYITEDLGKTWTHVIDNVHDFSWGMYDMSHRLPLERIIVVHAVEEKKSKSHASNKLQVSYSDDLFNTTNVILEGANKFMMTADYLFFVKPSEDTKEDVALFVCNPRFGQYKLREVEIPTRVQSRGYTVLDSSEYSVFLHIDHSSSTHGNLYISSFFGSRYSLSLMNHARNFDGQCDFERVKGLEGVYLANVYDTDAVKQLERLEANSDVEIPQQKKPLEKTKKKLEDFKQTVISFDKGGMWVPLTPPEQDANGKRIGCQMEEECRLHLHSTSSHRFGPFYSVSSALGIILGTGNVGSYLSNQPDEINTYLSRDGGLNWLEIAKGSHIYEIGDHGGIIVIAPEQHATKSVKYTWNEGLTWTELPISESDIFVTNIIIEPSNNGEKFIVFAREKGGIHGIVIALDFSSLHQRLCVLHDKPDTPESDYETWIPKGKFSPECMMGKRATYTRRKRESQCFTEELSQVWVTSDFCECTEEDWECDYGFAREGLGPCVPLSEKINNETNAIPEQCNGSYNVSSGYRKVVANFCKGGVNHGPITRTCPGSMGLAPEKLAGGVIMVLIIIGFMWLHSRENSEKAKGWVAGMKIKFKRLLRREGKKDGYTNKIPSSEEDDEDVSSNELFDGEEEEGREESVNLLGSNVGKRMTERKAMEAAKKQVPLLNKPKDKEN